MINKIKALLPHLAALLLFVVVSMAYFYPVLEGKELPQGDNSHAKGAAQELVEHEKATGEKSMWTNSMFGGMPAYQIKADSSKNIFRHLNNFFRFGLPYTTAAMLFLYMAGFYLLLLSFRVDHWLAVGGALAFALGSYNIIIIIAGHITKAYAIALMAPVVAGILYAYNRNRWIGALITAVALGMEIAYNHVQITYYLLLMVIIIGVARWIASLKESADAVKAGGGGANAWMGALLPFTLKNKEAELPVTSFYKTTLVLVLAAVLSILPNITNLWTTYEYGKYSIRGKSELKADEGAKEHSGLDKNYALDWSYGIHETMTLLVPNVVGGASEAIGVDNPALKGLDSNIAEAVAGQSKYWGGRVFTSGPVYAGAVVCFLFFIGAFYYRGREKWWLIIATIFSIMLAWGKNFLPLTDLMFYHFPFYNKFRTVEMALVIASFTIPLLGFLGLKTLYDKPELIRLQMNKFLIAVGLTAGVGLLLYIMPSAFYSFLSSQEKQMFGSLKAGEMAQGYAAVEAGLINARVALLKADALRTAIFVLLASASLWFYSMNKLSAKYMVGGIIILVVIDLWGVDKRYLNAGHFISKSKARQEFAQSNADKAILNDKGNDYRVMSLYRSPFNDVNTSYHHQSVGGYHGAKLRRYQDVIDAYLQNEWSAIVKTLQGAQSEADVTNKLADMQVVNMLNTRYLIYNPDAQPIVNPHAFGAAWFVGSVVDASDADEALKLLGQTDLRSSAVVESKFGGLVANIGSQPVAGSIEMTSYEPDHIGYKSVSDAEGLAVFSQIYYPAGWKAFIDGNEAPIIQADYILRALVIPAGNHNIEFKFEPDSFRYGQIISILGSLLIVALIVVAVVVNRKKLF